MSSGVMTLKEIIDRMDAGRRMTTTLLQRCDIGLDPTSAVKELAPTLSPIAVEAARRLVELCSFNFTATALILSGLVSDEDLEVAEIPEPPARPTRRTPDEIASEWLLRDPAAPSATPEDDRS
jgi:hypothetical protein